MNKQPSLIQKKIKELTTLIKHWNHRYYIDNVSEVSDAIYDQHLNELKNLELQYPQFKLPNSPTLTPGTTLDNTFSKFLHRKPMLSLNNAFEKADLEAFHKRISKFTNGKHTYYCEPKIDGLSIALIFKNNQLIVAATRGNGEVGENVTANVKVTRFAKYFLNHCDHQLFPKDFEVRGEVFITRDNFQQLNLSLHDQVLAELKVKFLKYRQSLIKMLQQYFGNFHSSTKDVKQTSYLNIKDNLDALLKTGDLSQFRLDANFELTFYFGKDDWSRTFIDFVAFLKQQKRFTLLTVSQDQKGAFVKLFFYLNLDTKLFTSARNFAAGSLRQLNTNITKQRALSFLFYELIADDLPITSHQSKHLEWLKKKGFPISPYNRHCLDLPAVFSYIEHIDKLKTTFPYDIDGVVVKVNEQEYYPQIGQTTKFPNSAIAFKYQSLSAETIVLDIFPTVGRTGRITYNAKLKNVFLANTIVRAATLHNAQYIEKLDVRLDDYVAVKKAGDIIPKIVAVNFTKRPANTQKWKRVEQCPSCQNQLVIHSGEVDQYCPNNNCSERQIQALIHFVSQSAMNIVGLSKQTLRLFWKHQLIQNVTDIFRLETKKELIWALKAKNDFNKLGSKSLRNLFQAIEKAKNNSLEKLLFGLNIRYLGVRAAKVIAQTFCSMPKLITTTHQAIAQIEGLGPILAKSIVNFFQQQSNLTIIQELTDLGVNMEFITINVSGNKFFFNKIVVITGLFTFASRTELIDRLSKCGATVTNTVSKKVNYLILGNSPGSKLIKAQQLAIEILDAKVILKLLWNK